MEDLGHLSGDDQKQIDANHLEYGENSKDLRWITLKDAQAAEKQRAEILSATDDYINWQFKQTKPASGPISPGCQICGNGAWSCLFINGKCNCRCFYCPTVQDEISIPMTNQIPFEKTSAYTDYIDHFGFSGVSISGGEPLLTFARTLEYIQAVRHKNNPDIHLWMYTNGTLLKEEYVRQLADAGLSEIRFDISARDYDLSKLKLAVGHIPVVTVEIPAIPEDFDVLAKILPEMSNIGVNYLNLHQLRLTPHNHRFLKQRAYTFLHGEKVTVLESEMTALKLLELAMTQKLKLPINYCAFTYKNQFQRAAARKRNAHFIIKPHESLTEKGYIRTLTVSGDPEQIASIAQKLSNINPSKDLWQINTRKTEILFHDSLWCHFDNSMLDFRITYAEAVLRPALSYHYPFKEICLASGKKIYAEKIVHKKNIKLDPMALDYFEKRVLDRKMLPLTEKHRSISECLYYEFIVPGLQKYF